MTIPSDKLPVMDHCEEMLPAGTAPFGPQRFCRGRGLVIAVHPDGVTRKVMCKQHSRKAYMSGYRVDWDETARVFPDTSRRGGDQKRDGIGRMA